MVKFGVALAEIDALATIYIKFQVGLSKLKHYKKKASQPLTVPVNMTNNVIIIHKVIEEQSFCLVSKP